MLLPEVLLLMAGHPSALFRVVCPAVDLSGPSSSSTPARSSSPFGSWTYEIDTSIPGIHAGEVANLNALACLAARHARVTIFANAQLARAKVEVLRASRGTKAKAKASGNGKASEEARQSKLMAPLCAMMIDVLREYRQLILETEADVLRHDASLTDLTSLRDPKHNRGGSSGGDGSSSSSYRPFVSLSSIRARFAPWETSLAALDALVQALLRGPSQIGFPEESPTSTQEEGIAGSVPRCPSCPIWSSGLLLDTLSLRAHTGIGLVASHLTRLLVACEDYWKRGLVAWMCHGVAEPGHVRGGASASAPASTPAAVAFEPLIEWHDALDGDNEDGAPPPLPGDEATMDSTGWRFVRNALPQSIAEDAALSDAILSVGRALSLLAANSRSTSVGSSTLASVTPRSLPATLVASHSARLAASDVRPSRPTAFRRAVMEVREEVGEWMWRNVLTPASVIEAIEALGGYFLHRRGLFVPSLLQEMSSLRRHKLLTATSAAGATLQPSDIELALYRASVGTDAEDDAHLELCKVVVAPKRMKKAAARTGSNGGGGLADAARFDDLALGPSFSLAYTAHFPLDLFLTPRDLRNYSAVFSYLLAIRGAQARLRGCWMDMSKKQRLRRRFTGTGEGGANRAEEKERGELLRMAWGAAREALWFLEALGAHFQTDIIDVQFSRLKDQLQLAQVSSEDAAAWSSDVDTDGGEDRIRFPSKLGSLPGSPERRNVALAGSRIRRSSGPAPGGAPSIVPSATWKPRLAASSRAPSISGLRSHAQQHRAPAAAAAAAAGSLRPSSTAPQDSALDFASIRAVHSSYLSFVLDGLLLTSPAATAIVRKVLEICDRFVGMVERWGGDVLPDLLMEGSIVGQSGEDTVGKSVRERTAKVQEVAQVLRLHVDDFFALLSSAFEGNPQGSGDVTAGLDVSLGSLSVLHPATQLPLARTTASAPVSALAKARSPNLVHTAAPADPKERARAKANEARLEADSAARRHLEQLLLRLDWNDFLGKRSAQTRAG